MAGQVATSFLQGTITKIENHKDFVFTIKPHTPGKEMIRKSSDLKLIPSKDKQDPKFHCSLGCKPFSLMEEKALQKLVGKKVLIEWTLDVSYKIPKEVKTFRYDQNLSLIHI